MMPVHPLAVKAAEMLFSPNMHTTITINGKQYPRTDCISWSVAGVVPSCRRGLDLAQCDTCEQKIPRPKFADKISGYIKAEASQVLHGPLDDQKYQARIAHCLSCTALDKKDAPLVGHCTECACGKSRRAEMTVKARMPYSTCPRKLWAT